MVAVVGVTVAWGMFTGSRRELMTTLRLRADTAEAEQTARVAQARIAERNRIAREMHDVLAHRISTVAMHAGALTFRDDLDAEQVRSSAQIIQQSSHQAMIDLREVLGILREGPGDSQPDLPQPSASDLDDLVEEARRTGTNLQATIDVDLAGIPPGVGRTVYRVVQEALTTVRKHAPGTKVTLTLTGQPGSGLDLQVTNPLPVGGRETSLPSSGLGLVGLAERVQLAGGTIARHHGQRHFTLHVWLPWPT
jgi:signal transduction histidine kinase